MNLPRVSWYPIGPVSFGCWFWSHIINKNRLSTKPRDFIADIPCFDMRWMWANSKIRIFVCRTLSLSTQKPNNLKLTQKTWHGLPKSQNHSHSQHQKHYSNLSIALSFDKLNHLRTVFKFILTYKGRKRIPFQFETVTESAVNISFHSLSDGGLNFCSSSK